MVTREEILNSRLLIIDDNQTNVDLLEDILTQAGFQSILSITDSRKSMQIYSAYQPHLLLLDINMPYLDGYQVMEGLKEIVNGSYLPVLVLTALQDKDTRIKVLQSGAQDFLTKPFDKIEVITRIENMLMIRHLHDQVKNQNEILEKKVQERTIELETTRLEIIQRLGAAAEYRDPETGGHILRMSHMCSLLGKLAGMSDSDVSLLLTTSPMHDVGKIGIPDQILLKGTMLSMEEMVVMQSHTTIGGKLLDGSESQLMKVAREIALTHHEKWDGEGYPAGLAGEQIPIFGRIACIADVFDALRSKRPYKQPYPLEKAIEIMKSERGKHFDPELLDLFVANLGSFVEIHERFSEPGSSSAGFFLSERDQSSRDFF